MKHVPRKLIDDSGTEWLFWKHDKESKAPLSYRLRKWKGCLSVAPYQVETMFTREGRPEPKSNIVVQGKYECAAASLAMLLDEKLFFVKRAMGKMGWRNDDGGANDEVMIKAARFLGKDLIRVNRDEVKKGLGPCSVTLPSLNLKGRFHAVTWNGEQILDPNWGIEGRKFWGCEWSPWTMGARGALVLLDRQLSIAERAEYDEAVRAKEEKEIKAIKMELIKILQEAS